MRIMFGSDYVVEVESISGLDNNGVYHVEFAYPNGEATDFYYKALSTEEAKKRVEVLCKQALEKGFADFSNEPWELNA